MSVELLKWVAILAAVVAGMIVLGRLMAQGEAQTRKARAKKALELLEARYAKGEVSREDYERQKREFEGQV